MPTNIEYEHIPIENHGSTAPDVTRGSAAKSATPRTGSRDLSSVNIDAHCSSNQEQMALRSKSGVIFCEI